MVRRAKDWAVARLTATGACVRRALRSARKSLDRRQAVDHIALLPARLGERRRAQRGESAQSGEGDNHRGRRSAAGAGARITK